MSDADKEPVYNAEDEAKTFDIYHLRNRKMVYVAIAVVIVLLLAVLYLVLSGTQVA